MVKLNLEALENMNRKEVMYETIYAASCRYDTKE